MLRSLIFGVLLLAACSPAEPPLMIDGSRAPETSADNAPPQNARAADEDAAGAERV